jgi:MFS family permease
VSSIKEESRALLSQSLAWLVHLQGRFPALAQSEFRWYWFSMLGYSFGMQARGVIVGWLIYQLTGSALSLGWYFGTWGLGALICSFFGGAFCDRYGSRRVVIGFRLLSALALLSLFALDLFGWLAFWQLLAFNLVNGVVSAFEYPARTSLIAEIIDEEALTSGFALTYTAMNAASIIGPATMGWVTEALGARPALLITGLIVLSGVLTVLPINLGNRASDDCDPEGDEERSVLADVTQGLRHVFHDPNLRLVEGVLLIYVLILVPYRNMLPAVAADVLQVGASGLGLLSSAISVGALLGTLFLSTLGEVRPRGAFLLGSALFKCLGVLVFSQSRWMGLSLLVLGIAGIGRGIFIPLNNTLLQVHAPPGLRARVVGMNMTIWSLMPLGSVVVGALADQIGTGQAILISAGLGGVLLLLFGLLVPRLRQMD